MTKFFTPEFCTGQFLVSTTLHCLNCRQTIWSTASTNIYINNPCLKEDTKGSPRQLLSSSSF